MNDARLREPKARIVHAFELRRASPQKSYDDSMLNAIIDNARNCLSVRQLTSVFGLAISLRLKRFGHTVNIV